MTTEFEKLDSFRIERLKDAQKEIIKKAIKDGGTEGVILSAEEIEELKKELDENLKE